MTGARVIVRKADHGFDHSEPANHSQIANNSEQRELLKFGTSTANEFGKVYVVPRGTPADRAAALESAFTKVFTDKELQADAVKGKLEVDPTIGEDIPKWSSNLWA